MKTPSNRILSSYQKECGGFVLIDMEEYQNVLYHGVKELLLCVYLCMHRVFLKE